jgi:hypothetical protein
VADEALIGYTQAQHRRISNAVAAFEARAPRGEIGVTKKPRAFPQTTARVMQIDDGYPVYEPDKIRNVAVFVLGPRNRVRTIEMTGDDLHGDINVTIDDAQFGLATWNLNCQSQTEAVRKKFGFLDSYCRVTVFPGMWEFVFADEPPAMFVEARPSSGDNLFSGGLQLINERWVSIDDGNGGVKTIEATDSMPFLEGEVKRGSRALAHWSDSEGWIIGQWQCRPFWFRPAVT